MGHNWGVSAELLWYPSGPVSRREPLVKFDLAKLGQEGNLVGVDVLSDGANH